MANSSFREYIPEAGTHPRLGKAVFSNYDAYSWVEFGKTKDFIVALLDGWRKSDAAPFRGVTTDGEVERNLFNLREEDAPVQAMVEAASNLIAEAETACVSEELRFPLETEKWRLWANPEFYFAQHGLRFEEHSEALQSAAMTLVKMSLSPKGYEEVLGAMRINEFLGGVIGATRLMNKRSYNFVLFGEPSVSSPWGWALWGHHLAYSVLVLGGQMVVSPVFRGCEPNYIDTDESLGKGWFDDEMQLAIGMMNMLSDEERQKVTLYDTMDHPDMPAGFPHPADGRIIAGAHQDNVMLPYEGGQVSTFSKPAQLAVLDLVEKFIGFLPQRPLELKMDDIRRHLDRTWLAWIGGYGEEDVFYFRVHSPVAFMYVNEIYKPYWGHLAAGRQCLREAEERPRPAGRLERSLGNVIVSGMLPVHTVVRTPNGNDYGKELVRLWKERQ